MADKQNYKKYSGHYCAALWCNNNMSSKKGISMHKFPADPARCKEWLLFIARDDLLGKSAGDMIHHRLCSDHFPERFIRRFSTRNFLTFDAVPTILVAEALQFCNNNVWSFTNAGPSLADNLCGDALSHENCSLAPLISDASISLGPGGSEGTTPPSEPARAPTVEKHSGSALHAFSDAIVELCPSVLDIALTGCMESAIRDDLCVSIPTATDMVIGTAPMAYKEEVVISETIETSPFPVSSYQDMCMGNDEPMSTFQTPKVAKRKLTYLEEPNSTPKRRKGLASSAGDMNVTPEALVMCQESKSSGRSNPTPRTARKLLRYRRHIRVLRARLFRASKQEGVKTRPSKLKKIIEASRTYLPESCHRLFVSQLKLSQVNKYGRRWPPHIKDFALSLYYHSPRTYRFLQKTLCLPSVRTLFSWQKKVAVKPGIDNNVLASLREFSRNLTVADRVVALVIDEVAVKENLSYDTSTDSVLGFCNDGHVQTPDVGRLCLVAMVKGINRKWKQILGYWVTHEGTKPGTVKGIVLDCIQSLIDIGFIVKVLICDQGPHNQFLARSLGVSVSEPFFVVNDLRIHFMYDPPHLLKSMRNNLMKYEFDFDGKIVKWADFKAAAECSDPLRLKLMPKITKSHTHTGAFQKMKVKYAAQVFSSSVSVAITVLIAMGLLHSSAAATAEFIDFMDKLCDCLNSVQLNVHEFKLRYAISSNSKHNEFLLDVLKKFMKSRFLGCRRQPACLNGWIISVKSVLALAEELRNHFGIPKLCTRVLNQDALENVFSVIRQQHGCSDNPTVVQFGRGFRHILLSSLPKLSDKSNCELDLEEVLLTLNKFLSERPPPSDKIDFMTINVDDVSSYEVGDVEANVLYYVTGYLCKKFINSHKCELCKSLLVDFCEEGRVFQEFHQTFTYLKAHEGLENEFGGLTLPQEELFQFVKKCEEIFQSCFFQRMHETCIGQKMKTHITGHESFEPVKLCSQEAFDMLLSYFIKVRIFWAIRFFNQKRIAEKMKDTPYARRSLFKAAH